MDTCLKDTCPPQPPKTQMRPWQTKLQFSFQVAGIGLRSRVGLWDGGLPNISLKALLFLCDFMTVVCSCLQVLHELMTEYSLPNCRFGLAWISACSVACACLNLSCSSTESWNHVSGPPHEACHAALLAALRARIGTNPKSLKTVIPHVLQPRVPQPESQAVSWQRSEPKPSEPQVRQ